MTMLETLDRVKDFYLQFLKDRRPESEDWSPKERSDAFGLFLAGITAYVVIRGTTQDRLDLIEALASLGRDYAGRS